MTEVENATREARERQAPWSRLVQGAQRMRRVSSLEGVTSRAVIGAVRQEPGSPAASLLEIMENADHGKPLVLLITSTDTLAVKAERLVEEFRAAGSLVYDLRCPISADYTLADARDDIFATYLWLVRSENLFDRARVVFFGASICGNLAVEASLATGNPAIAWSAPFDLLDFANPIDQPLHDGRVDNDTFYASTTRDNLRVRIATCAPSSSMQEEASPILRVHAGCGPIYMANSLAEAVPTRQPLRMQAELTHARIATTLQFLSGDRHGYDYLDGAIEPTVDFIGAARRNEPAAREPEPSRRSRDHSIPAQDPAMSAHLQDAARKRPTILKAQVE